mmetsp:Transcript_102396/g.142590  ORF Transcript_102396/g.142590 Transcript_102396/m.142590 type:complete len:370 (-) Transcript_102396:431-1540(-)
MRQVSTAWQVQAHDTGMRRQQRSVDSEVGWASRVRLYIHTPMLLIKAECLQRTRFAQVLDLVNHLVATVVAVSRLTLGVFVGQCRPKALHHSPRGKVLGGDQLDASHLPSLLLLHQFVHRRVCLHQRAVAGQRWPVAVSLCARGDTLGRNHEFGIRLDCLEGCCLCIADLSQALEDANHHLLQVQGVEVQAGGTTVQELLAHVHAFSDAELLESLVGGVRLLRTLQEPFGQAGLAELGHALEAPETVEAHDTRDDRHLDVVLAALIDKVQENLGIEEHLRDDEVGTCIHLLLEIDHLLVEVCISAHGDHLLALGIGYDAGAALLRGSQSRHTTFDHLNVIRMALRIASHRHREIIAVVLADELHEVQSA